MPWIQQGGGSGGADGVCTQLSMWSALCAVSRGVMGSMWTPESARVWEDVLHVHAGSGTCSCGGAGLGDMPVLGCALDGKGEPGLWLLRLGRV